MKRKWRWPLAGFITGGLVGMTLLTVNVIGAFVGNSGTPPAAAERSSFEILHTPPLLVSPGEKVDLTYEVVCPPEGDDPRSEACVPQGSVYVRRVGEPSFAEIPLAGDRNGRLSASVPPPFTSGAGFDYYVEIEDGRGESAALPQGGAEAPEHTWAVSSWTTVDLGTHTFGVARPPDATLTTAGWGSGDGDLGLESGPEQSRIGPSAFDVGPDGSIVVLDQVNSRLAVYRPDSPTASKKLPIDFVGAEGDLAVAGDGTTYVLDDGGAASPMPIVRALDAAGGPVASTPLAEPVADMVRIGPEGPIVHAYPSEQWLPTGPGRPPLDPAEQVARARTGRAVSGGVEVVVRASPTEAQFALVGGDRVIRSWRVTSSTSLGEVQLAEPYRDGLVAVVRLWTEKEAEFRVLRLAPERLAGSFAVDRAEWAETAALSRFRLHGGSLYQLRSAPSGIEVVVFEIGGAR